MLGEKFKAIRTAQGKTLRDVQNDTGISNAYLSQLENGKINHPSYDIVQKLCTYYGIKTDVGNMDGLTMLISTMTDLEVETLTSFAKFLLSNRKI